MKIYDGFLFNDELDLLELRLMELYDLVDWFVLVEMDCNFMQREKPLHFQENMDRFSKWIGKIRHVVVQDYPIAPHPTMEIFQRRAIARGMSKDPNDVVIMGDVDEIPCREVLEKVRSVPPDHPFSCVQTLYYYYVNCQQSSPWVGTVIGPRRAFGVDMDCQKIRNDRLKFPALWQSGWHFSWLGPAKNIQNKLDSIDVTADAALYGSSDIVKPASSDVTYIQNCLETGDDLFGRTTELTKKMFVPIDPGARQPHCILEWLALHPEYAKVMEPA